MHIHECVPSVLNKTELFCHAQKVKSNNYGMMCHNNSDELYSLNSLLMQLD